MIRGTAYFEYSPNGWRCTHFAARPNMDRNCVGMAWINKFEPDTELAVSGEWIDVPVPGRFTKRPGELVAIKEVRNVNG